jgi:hypothetical protein
MYVPRKMATWLVLYASLQISHAQTPEPATSNTIGTLKDYLERTFTVTGSVRARWESTQGSDFAVTKADSYMLTRVRLGLGYAPTPWLRFFSEAEDARAEFYKVAPPSSIDDPFDLRQAYVEAGKAEGNGVKVRFGRQELEFGSQRLIANPDWSNVGKTYDALHGTITTSMAKIDLVAAEPLLVDTTRLDRHKPGEHFYVAYSSFGRLIKDAKLEPYFIARYGINVKSKSGVTSGEETLIGGVRLIGKLIGGFDYNAEAVRESGNYSTDIVQAFGYVVGLGWTTPSMPWKLHPNSDFVWASGDDGRKDGYHQSFDGLYGLNQPLNGLTGLFGWRNLQDFRAGADFYPVRRLKVKIDFRDVWLATLNDGLYNSSAMRTVFDAKATSNHVGAGVDSQFTLTIAKKNIFGWGVGYIAPGAYLKQAGKTTGYIYPYISYQRFL